MVPPVEKTHTTGNPVAGAAFCAELDGFEARVTNSTTQADARSLIVEAQSYSRRSGACAVDWPDNNQRGSSARDPVCPQSVPTRETLYGSRVHRPSQPCLVWRRVRNV